jgi:hypothetical protein
MTKSLFGIALLLFAAATLGVRAYIKAYPEAFRAPAPMLRVIVQSRPMTLSIQRDEVIRDELESIDWVRGEDVPGRLDD